MGDGRRGRWRWRFTGELACDAFEDVAEVGGCARGRFTVVAVMIICPGHDR